MKFFDFLIKTNIFISLAAVALTVETQIQLGLAPRLHPYLFIIFFATLFEYNLHRLVTVIKNPAALSDEKHRWVKNYPVLFYLLVFSSIAGFLISAALAKPEVLITLFPIGVLTLLYSLPIIKLKKLVYRLREIPLAKIFVISIVWSVATIVLVIIQSGKHFPGWHVALLLIERFIFVFAITIPFDIRDMHADRYSGIKTIPLLIGEEQAKNVAVASLILFALISTFHYATMHTLFMIPAILLSAITTILFITNGKVQVTPQYHYFVLDGTMPLQALLVYLCYCQL